MFIVIPTIVSHMRNLRLVLRLCSYTYFRGEVMSLSPNRNLLNGTGVVSIQEVLFRCISSSFPGPVYIGSRSSGRTSQRICARTVTSEVPGAMPFSLCYDLFWVTVPFPILSSPEAHQILLGLWVKGKSLLTSAF